MKKHNKKSAKIGNIEILRIEKWKAETKRSNWRKKELTPLRKQTESTWLDKIKSIFSCKCCDSLADNATEIILT